MTSNVEVIEVIDLTAPNDVECIDLTQHKESIDLTNENENEANNSVHISDTSEQSASPPPPGPNAEENSGAWYDDPNANHPFELSLKGKPEGSTTNVVFADVSFFPWDATFPVENLWSDDPYIPRAQAKSTWETVVNKWSHRVAMCGGKMVRIVQTYPSKSRAEVVFQIKLPSTARYIMEHLTWALDPWTLNPLLLFVHTSVIHIFDLERLEPLGWLRGHGGSITSIGVNIYHPHLVYTTSRDFTVRIHDLRWTSESWNRYLEKRTNARDVLDPFGIKTHNEDSKLGRCVTVLTGGRSGGHEAAVLGADFHPSLPLLATCGMDHAIRIWYLSPTLFQKSRFLDQTTAKTFREDKPLFSSTIIHDGRVLSVHWLSDDILVSNSAPPYQVAPDGQSNFGRMVVWKWLSLNRFFPEEQKILPNPPLRGCISDYRESASLKIISLVKLAKHTPRLRIGSNEHGPPLILLPHTSGVIITNPCHLPIRPRSLIPYYQSLRLNDWLSEIPEIEGWVLNSVFGENLADEEVLACTMSPDGMVVAGIGENEVLWIWTRKRSEILKS